MNDIAQYYAILGIKHTASPEATKKAYRNLAKIWHPDRYLNNPLLKEKAEIEIKKINQAYAVIKAYQTENSHNLNIKKTVTQKNNYKSTSKVVKTKNTPEFYYQQGVEYAEAKNYEDALTNFTQAIKLNPDYLEAYQYRGYILSKLGYEYRADAEFKKAHRIKVKNKSKYTPANQYQSQAYTYQQYSTKATKNTQSNNQLKCYHTILAANQAIRCIAIGKNSQAFASANNDPEIKLWQLNNGQRITTLRGHTDAVTCLTMSNSGQTLVSGSQDKTIRFWDLKEKKIIRTLGGYFNGHLNTIVALAISPDNQTLLSCSADKSLKIWDVNRGRETHNISFSAAMTCIAFSPNGQIFCSGGLEPQLRIREIKNGQVIRSINNDGGVLSLAFSPDGNLLATGGFNRCLKLWDITTGKEIYTLQGHSDRVSAVNFSSDGKTLISGSWDKTIKLWNLVTGKKIASVTGHTNKIHAMAIARSALAKPIASDNQTLISGSADQTIKLWRYNF
ncbi:DnaJ domain-containing protein [Pleurocapsa sp. PCC 7319]|uniref:WD40 domain-containing protein n=1 Tax=Pleurocapsa sp. PCC 7319 TaxID=118161 RepID=UPI00034AD395|nr:DnaJ domain-containing protein [Pleurocapsa sp. PCC 7319]